MGCSREVEEMRRGKSVIIIIIHTTAAYTASSSTTCKRCHPLAILQLAYKFASDDGCADACRSVSRTAPTPEMKNLWMIGNLDPKRNAAGVCTVVGAASSEETPPPSGAWRWSSITSLMPSFSWATEQRLREEQREQDSTHLRNLQKTQHTVLMYVRVKICYCSTFFVVAEYLLITSSPPSSHFRNMAALRPR